MASNVVNLYLVELFYRSAFCVVVFEMVEHFFEFVFCFMVEVCLVFFSAFDFGVFCSMVCVVEVCLVVLV